MYLKEFREKLNLTQNELSNILDIAQTTIARYENDKVKPTSTVLLKYINELNANPNFLFLGIEPHTLNNIPELDSSNMGLLNDITLMISQEQLKEKLNKILIDEIIQRFEKQDDSLVTKLLEIFDFIPTVIGIANELPFFSLKVSPALLMYNSSWKK